MWRLLFVACASGNRVLRSAHSSLSRVQAGKGLMIIDGGSSGTKVFTYSGTNAKNAKLLTTCADTELKGISSMKVDTCKWKVGTDEKKLTDLASRDKYSCEMLDLIGTTYKTMSGKKDFSDVDNKGAIPMLATAGMRLLTEAENTKVWGYLCGKEHDGLKVAAKGPKCGTIPGTQEAFYEFMANAANAKDLKSRVLTGTFAVGGASAQISIPLKDKAAVDAFLAMKGKVKTALKCADLKVGTGAAPVFNTGGNCLEDFIDFRNKTEISATADVKKNNIKVDSIEGLGLISFLGLKGEGTLVAGGVNEIANWAKTVKCHTTKDARSYSDCLKDLTAALEKDVLWKHVSEYFRAQKTSMGDFSFNTNAAIPSRQSVSTAVKENDGTQAWTLKTELEKACGKDNSQVFGDPDFEITCMKATFTAMFTTSFFCKDQASKLHFDPKRDWAEGLKEESEPTASLVEEMSDVKDATGAYLSAKHLSLLQIPLQRGDWSYIDGARLHFR